MTKAFVIGHPIEHSRSPLIHGHWLKEHGLAGSYERIDVAPEDFAGFLNSFADQGFVGGNVTIPHKEAAFAGRRPPHARGPSASARSTRSGSRTASSSATTPTSWASWPISTTPRRRLGAGRRDALVIGAGGAARAVVAGLQERGIGAIVVANRTAGKADEVVRDLAVDAPEGAGGTGALRTIPFEDLARAVGGGGAHRQHDLARHGGPAAARPRSRGAAGRTRSSPISSTCRSRRRFCADAEARGPADRSTGSACCCIRRCRVSQRWFGVRPEVTPDLRGARSPPISETGAMTFVLGLTGSIGMGKSATAGMFRERGVPVHDADAAVHAPLSRRGRAADRRGLSGRRRGRRGRSRGPRRRWCSASPTRLRRLEAIVHPLVRAEESLFLRARRRAARRWRCSTCRCCSRPAAETPLRRGAGGHGVRRRSSASGCWPGPA